VIDWPFCPDVERDPDHVRGAWDFRGTQVAACTNMLSNLNNGLWDLQVRHPKDNPAIFETEDMDGTPSFIKGIVDGCIDAQKRIPTRQSTRTLRDKTAQRR
jgi:hypothetical protein